MLTTLYKHFISFKRRKLRFWMVKIFKGVLGYRYGKVSSFPEAPCRVTQDILLRVSFFKSLSEGLLVLLWNYIQIFVWFMEI